MSKTTRFTIKLLGLIAVTSALALPASAQDMHTDHYVPSRPHSLTWGAFPIDKAPVATVKSGQTVRIDTLSHAGSTQDEPPAEFLAGYGVKRDEILQDVPSQEFRRRLVLCGPGMRQRVHADYLS